MKGYRHFVTANRIHKNSILGNVTKRYLEEHDTDGVCWRQVKHFIGWELHAVPNLNFLLKNHFIITVIKYSYIYL